MSSRPATTGTIANSRTRTPASGKTNRRESPNITSTSKAANFGSRSTGQWSLTKTQSARPQIESTASPRSKTLETVCLGRGRVPQVKDWVSEHHDKMRPHPPAFADTMVDTAMDKEKGIQQAYERFNANRARKKLQRLREPKVRGVGGHPFHHDGHEPRRGDGL